MIKIGQINSLEVIKKADFGVFLDGDDTVLFCCQISTSQRAQKLAIKSTCFCTLIQKANWLRPLKPQSLK